MKTRFKRYWKLGLAMLIIGFALGIIGCGGLGGQGFSVSISADNGSTIENVNIDFNADDGGTDLGGLWYKAKDPTQNVVTTQPAEPTE